MTTTKLATELREMAKHCPLYIPRKPTILAAADIVESEGYLELARDQLLKDVEKLVGINDTLQAKVEELEAEIELGAYGMLHRERDHLTAENERLKAEVEELEQRLERTQIRASEWALKAGQLGSDKDTLTAENERLKEREQLCATLDEAEKIALIRALQEIRDDVGLLGDGVSPRQIVDSAKALAAENAAYRRIVTALEGELGHTVPDGVELPVVAENVLAKTLSIENATLRRMNVENSRLASVLSVENAALRESIESTHKMFARDNKSHVERAYKAEADNARLKSEVEKWSGMPPENLAMARTIGENLYSVCTEATKIKAENTRLRDGINKILIESCRGHNAGCLRCAEVNVVADHALASTAREEK